MTWPSGPLLRTLGCLALALLVYRSAPPPDALCAGLAPFVLIGGLWMKQVLHLSVTALLVPLLAVLTGLMDLRLALASFAHPIIFLFLGGLALAVATGRVSGPQPLSSPVRSSRTSGSAAIVTIPGVAVSLTSA
jgi:sodium-dependent dicarboxylate transporter 2/3/5